MTGGTAEIDETTGEGTTVIDGMTQGTIEAVKMIGEMMTGLGTAIVDKGEPTRGARMASGEGRVPETIDGTREAEETIVTENRESQGGEKVTVCLRETVETVTNGRFGSS